jgi:hypothetical protein
MTYLGSERGRSGVGPDSDPAPTPRCSASPTDGNHYSFQPYCSEPLQSSDCTLWTLVNKSFYYS